MSGEYVPTTDEIRYRVEHDWEPYGDGSFDAWLSAHDAQVRAEALREASKNVTKAYPSGPLNCTELCGRHNCTDDIRIHMAREVANWLRDRADDIARGGRG